MSRKNEAYMPPELVQRVLDHAPPDVMLIGGQALAYWMQVYDVGMPADSGAPAISRDVDLFTPNAANSGPLRQFARALRGRAEISHARSLSALIGSAVAPAEDGRVYNVDLLHSVVGLQRDRLEANAVVVSLPGTGKVLRVMHPLDVLQSRNANLHTLIEKQDETGRLQLRLAIEVARAYLEEQIEAIAQGNEGSEPVRRRAILDLIGTVSDMSAKDAARKNAERYGIHLADAIPAWRIESDTFWKKQWPRLRERMSPEYADRCEQRARRNSAPRS
ncbi:MAG: hypothetical protein QM741_01655 [Rudaea sp.]|uniref:hypothetical protein n=1 Tax=Rudaea sp. TaxID=2136325 RepID=UPI0039E4A35A